MGSLSSAKNKALGKEVFEFFFRNFLFTECLHRDTRQRYFKKNMPTAGSGHLAKLPPLPSASRIRRSAKGRVGALKQVRPGTVQATHREPPRAPLPAVPAPASHSPCAAPASHRAPPTPCAARRSPSPRPSWMEASASAEGGGGSAATRSSPAAVHATNDDAAASEGDASRPASSVSASIPVL